MPTRKAVTKTAGVSEAAAELGLSEDTVRRDLRRGAPHTKEKGQIRFNLDRYREWRDANNLTGQRGRPKPEDPADLAAAKLAKLQEEVRIKRAQADRDERRADRERGTHQDLDDLREMLTALGSVLKNGVERMQRRFGPQAAVEFNEVLDEFGQLVRKHVGRVAGAGVGGTGPAAADPAGVR